MVVTPHISVVIPTHLPKKNRDSLLKLFTSLKEDNLSRGLDIILVANFSRDLAFLENLLREMREYFYDLRIFATNKESANIARNFGAMKARANYLYFIDDDCALIKSNYLESLLQFMKENADISALGGGYTESNEQSKKRRNHVYAYLASKWLENAVENERGETCYLIGGNTLYRREVFDEGFNFDPQMSYGGTETSLNVQLYQHGKILIYRSEFKVYHHFNLSFFEFIKKAYRQGGGKAHNLQNNLTLKSSISKKKISSDRQMREENLFYFKLYDYFFQLGLNSKTQKHKIPLWKRGLMKMELIFAPPLVKKIYHKVRHFLYMSGIFIYYKIIHRIFCKIYYMSEYHWRVYLRPMGNFLLGRKKK
tara:strand:+ start:14164 stop:15261 length:1098 start_codon:yes stop_codon:yes gene_type:complete